MPARLVSGCLALLAVLALVACGSGSGSGSSGGSGAQQPSVAKPADFPRPAGRSLAQLRKSIGSAGPVLAPAVSVLTPGTNRFGFGLFDRARKQIPEAPTAVYVQSIKGGKVLGPFVAHNESLTVNGPFRSKTVANDPDAARSVYVARPKLPKPGIYNVLGVVRLDDRLVAADPAGPGLRVVPKDAVPGVGQKAIRMDTPTIKSTGGDIAKIDTRDPHDFDMHQVNYADALGKRPIMLVFATPALCQSRVCGPVVDVAEQVKAAHRGEADWVHMEIYNDNQVQKGFRPQVLKWHLPTEPWVFAIDRHGRIAARLEGAFSARELEAALKAAKSR